MAFTHDKPVLRYVKSSTLSKGGDHPPQVGTEMADKLNSKYSEMWHYWNREKNDSKWRHNILFCEEQPFIEYRQSVNVRHLLLD